MNWYEKELEWLENEAVTVQRKYPNAKSLPVYLEVLSHRAELIREELRRTEELIASIPDLRMREIACYRLLEGLTYREIAEMMHLNSRYVQRLWRPYGKESTEKRR